MRPSLLLTACVVVAAALPATAAAAGSTCDESQAWVPRQGLTAITYGSASAGALLPPTGRAVKGLAFSPDGTRAYATRYSDLSNPTDLTEIDVATGQVTRTLTGAGGPGGLVVSADGTTAFIATDPATSGVKVVDLTTFTQVGGIALQAAGHQLAANHLALSPDGRTLYVAANWSGTIWKTFAIDVATRTVVRDGDSGSSHSALAVSSDGRYVITTHAFSGAPGQVRILDAATLTQVRAVSVGTNQEITDVATASDPTLVYALNRSASELLVIDVTTGQVIRTITGVTSASLTSASSLAVTWDGTRAVTVGADGSYSQAAWQVFNPSSGALVSAGVTSGAGGMPDGDVVLCPRLVPDPPTPASAGSGGTQTPSATACPVAPVVAGSRRVSRRAGRAVLTQSFTMRTPGRYTFMVDDSAGRRVGLLRGTTIAARTLGRTFTAPVLTTRRQGQAVSVSARLSRKGADGTRIRTVLKLPDGRLCPGA